MQHCHFPFDDAEKDKTDLLSDTAKVREHDAKNLIRLLTRTLFVWFIKERQLVPECLFHPVDLKNDILKEFDPESKDTHYYKAILQNLFFATLNQTHGKREFRSEGQHQNTTTLLRYRDQLKDPDGFITTLEASTPFLNGGLFDCLDYPHPTKKGRQGGSIIVYEDGFSDRKENPLALPDFLFFGSERHVDLSGDLAYGAPAYASEKVRGLIHILNRYKFTIVENTPIDQEIALDPELLGQVFENLLASYNEETKTTARKQTGSFYTPRPIVDYMVDESLKTHLSKALCPSGGASSRSTDNPHPGMSELDAKAGLDILFAYTEKEHAFTSGEVAILIRSIDSCKILDPACGSGAFPMGVLQKLVFILSKLDPDNQRWKSTQLDKLDSAPMRESLESDFADNDDDYGRKLYLIENCLYGVDIQSIATQVSKLRFFISLIVDQRVDRGKDNFGVRPLPNLETKFVTANTLIQIDKPASQGELAETADIAELQQQLKRVRHALFTAKTPRTKNKYREEDQQLREQIASELKANGWGGDSAQSLAAWDPYDQNASSPYFDPEWMFGEQGFDIVIGNPPYIQIQKFPKAQKDLWVEQAFQTYAATADIYCLFYERGAQLLKDGGTLCYITSNKWMRAGYGKKLREFLSTKVDTGAVLDFGMAQNFGAATTYTCILNFSKHPSQSETQSCYVADDRAAMADPEAYFSENAVIQNNLSSDAWVVLSKDRQRIKSLVEEQGVPLEKWDIQINYGIKTGYNDAFYITTEQRDALIAEDPTCEDLIVPLLRGRYVERYATNWDGEWMLFIPWHFPLQEDPSVGGCSKQAEKLFMEQHPVIFRHLEQHKEKLSARNKAETGIRYEWYALQRWASSYWREFQKPKIIYPNMTKFLPFYYDEGNGFFGNQKCFIITDSTESLPYLTSFLNSQLFKCCFKDSFPELLGHTYELSKIFFEKIPIRKPTASEVTLFTTLVLLIQFAKTQDDLSSAATFLEDLIDACVMECYFREHMAERNLLFHDELALHLAAYDPEASEADQRDFLDHLHRTLNAPDAKIRNRLLRIPTDSPDLLAIIKQEGKV